MGPYPKRKPGNASNYANKKQRYISSTARSAQNRAMSFVPRSLGNTLATTERKFWDTVVIDRAINTVTTTFSGAMADPTTLNCLFTPITGAEMYNRIARKTYVHKISVVGRISLPVVSNATTLDVLAPLTIRLILCIDKQTNGAQMNSQDLIGALSGVTGDTIDLYQNPAFFGRFQVLKDKRFVLQNAATAVEQNFILDRQGLTTLFKWVVKFRKPIVVHYNNVNVGTVGDVVDNSFHFLAAVQTPSNSSIPILNYRARTIFTDP